MTAKPMTYWRTPDAVTDEINENNTDVIEAAEPEAVEQEVAESAWIAQVHPVLAEVAAHYHRLITHTDLAARLQDDTGLRTRSNPKTWVGRVLAAAAAIDVEKGRPPLTALVVDKADGTVGATYDEVLRLTGQNPITDDLAREKHAALARMECYRWAGALMPADGGNAALSPRYDMVVTRDRRKAREEAQPDVCPTCFMAIPPTGICDNCA